MSLDPSQISIAVTVYNRRHFVKQAVRSALTQTSSVSVLILEDCGPDPGLQDFITSEFGSAVRYVRNPARRGLFGNWNACLEACRTPWLSILHDDDYLAPCFVDAMVQLEVAAPGHPLYFGQVLLVDENGQALSWQDTRPVQGPWMRRGLKDILYVPFAFPGQLFHVATAKAVGGFRDTSYFCGDWEMWGRLMAQGGAAQSGQLCCYMRVHEGMEKGTNEVIRKARQYPAIYVQHKRILALLRGAVKFKRSKLVARFPVSTTFLLRYASTASRRLFRYHFALFLLSQPPHWRYSVCQKLARLAGPDMFRFTARIWNVVAGKFPGKNHSGPGPGLAASK